MMKYFVIKIDQLDFQRRVDCVSATLIEREVRKATGLTAMLKAAGLQKQPLALMRVRYEKNHLE